MKRTDDTVLCACFSITLGQLRSYLNAPGKSVDDFVQETRFGTRCTACLLDLDVVISDLDVAGRSQRHNSRSAVRHTADAQGSSPVERVDSGFFVANEDVWTTILLANYAPLFGDGPESVAHRYRLWLLDENGTVKARKCGVVPSKSEAVIDLKNVDDCPSEGWFLISLLPLAAGYYGTLRPQALLIGQDWASAFHTQFLGFATNQVRRLSVGVQTTGGSTWTTLSILNGERRSGRVTIRLTGAGNVNLTHSFDLPGMGSRFINLDTVFPVLPEDEGLIASVESTTRTRKYIINKQPDGSWGADHFPTFP
ncbi:MAG: (2Fe-2S)-binding protein [Rhodospirillales bacterium]